MTNSTWSVRTIWINIPIVKNILFISRNFPPLTGGMERLAWRTYQSLSTNNSVTIIGPTGCKNFISSKDKAIECSPKLYRFLFQSLYAAIIETKCNKFDICIGGNGLAAPILLIMKILKGINTAIFVHGLDLIANNIFYKLVFVPCIAKCDLIIANSKNTAKLAGEAGVVLSKIAILFPGVEYPPNHADTGGTFRQRYELTDRKIVLSVGRLIKRKGLEEFVEYSLPEVLSSLPNCILVIIGDQPKNAIKKDSVNIKSNILKKAKELNLAKNIAFLGKVDEQTLQNAYAAADLFIFPVVDTSDDVEGFGMVALEAAAHGLPTIGFQSGGVSDAVIHEYTGNLVRQGDYAALSREIIDYLRQDKKRLLENNCVSFADSMSWTQFGKKLNQAISRFKITFT